jgi:hypothetical protein
MIMKKQLGLMILLFSITSIGFGQLTFSVAPGLSMNAANIGYKFNKIIPFIGLQYFGGSVDYDYIYDEFNYETLQIETMSQTSSAKVNLFLPNIGVKYFFKETDKLKAFATLNLAKPIVSGSVTFDDEFDEEVNNLFEGLSIWGGELSVGAEYYFDEHFSVGGEFGLRYIRVGSKTENDRLVYNPVTGEEVPTKSLYTAGFTGKPTFSRVSLNFYF